MSRPRSVATTTRGASSTIRSSVDTEYVFSGGNFPQCADSTCLDYIVNDEQGGFGYGVLGGGTDDPGLARDVARRVAESLTYEG